MQEEEEEDGSGSGSGMGGGGRLALASSLEGVSRLQRRLSPIAAASVMILIICTYGEEGESVSRSMPSAADEKIAVA